MGGNGRRGGSIAGRGGGSLSKRLMVSKDGLGGGGFLVLGGRSSIGAGGGKVKGGGDDFGVLWMTQSKSSYFGFELESLSTSSSSKEGRIGSFELVGSLVEGTGDAGSTEGIFIFSGLNFLVLVLLVEAIASVYGYIKNHKKTVKNGQARTRESEEYKKKPKNQSRSQKSHPSVKVVKSWHSLAQDQAQVHVSYGKAHKRCGIYTTKEAQAVTSRNDSLAILECT
ncbi:hypothetical protein Tco_0464868 [Tanacetum coccineum]